MSLKMSSVSTSANGGAYPAGLPGGGGPPAAQKGGWGCRKSTEGQKVLLGWSRECAESMEGGEAEKGHGTSGGTLTMVARGRIIWSVGFIIIIINVLNIQNLKSQIILYHPVDLKHKNSSSTPLTLPHV